jgi:hypothetical protein
MNLNHLHICGCKVLLTKRYIESESSLHTPKIKRVSNLQSIANILLFLTKHILILAKLVLRFEKRNGGHCPWNFLDKASHS